MLLCAIALAATAGAYLFRFELQRDDETEDAPAIIAFEVAQQRTPGKDVNLDVRLDIAPPSAGLLSELRISLTYGSAELPGANVPVTARVFVDNKFAHAVRNCYPALIGMPMPADEGGREVALTRGELSQAPSDLIAAAGSAAQTRFRGLASPIEVPPSLIDTAIGRGGIDSSRKPPPLTEIPIVLGEIGQSGSSADILCTFETPYLWRKAGPDSFSVRPVAIGIASNLTTSPRLTSNLRVSESGGFHYGFGGGTPQGGRELTWTGEGRYSGLYGDGTTLVTEVTSTPVFVSEDARRLRDLRLVVLGTITGILGSLLGTLLLVAHRVARNRFGRSANRQRSATH